MDKPMAKGAESTEQAVEEQPEIQREQDRFEAPAYRGSGKLEGMAAIVTCGDSGIGRAVALPYAREGADAIVYLSAHEDAQGGVGRRRQGLELLPPG